MKLSWLGHSCFLVETAEGSVVFDPYSPGSVPGVALPPVTADAVVCSHGHRDHGWAEGVRLSGAAPRFRLTGFDTFHDGDQGRLRGQNRVTVLEAEGLRLAHLGDLGHLLNEEQAAALQGLDVLLIPVGGHFTIDARQAAQLVRQLEPKLTIPMHYRGPGFGYDVIGPVEDFTAQFPAVQHWPSAVIDPKEAQAPIVVLKCPTI